MRAPQTFPIKSVRILVASICLSLFVTGAMIGIQWIIQKMVLSQIESLVFMEVVLIFYLVITFAILTIGLFMYIHQLRIKHQMYGFGWPDETSATFDPMQFARGQFLSSIALGLVISQAIVLSHLPTTIFWAGLMIIGEIIHSFR